MLVKEQLNQDLPVLNSQYIFMHVYSKYIRNNISNIWE